MEKHIQIMSDHWVKLLICLIVILGTQVHESNGANITVVEGAVEKGAVCLDGSPAAYYHEQGYGEGANNWVLYVQGGGWCVNETDCMTRTAGFGGGSNIMGRVTGLTGILNGNKADNPDLYNWNRVYLIYCDGGSFSGDVEEVDPKTNLHFRGARIFNAIVEDLLAKGMKNADNVILSGQSAGGLTTMLHCDQFRAQVPNAKKLKCLSDGGFFIRGEDIPGANESTIEQPYGDAVQLHRIDKFLPKSCTSKMDAKLCFYPENFVGDIKTPLFIMNGLYDKYQVPRKVNSGSVDAARCASSPKSCTETEIQALQGFRTSLLKALPKADCSSKGMFIDSSSEHDRISYSRWNKPLKFTNKTPAEIFGDWYFERNCLREIDQDITPTI